MSVSSYLRRLRGAKWLTVLFGIGVAGYFVYVYRRDGLASLALLANLDLPIIAVTVTLYSVAFLVAATVWSMLLTSLGVSLPWRQHVAIYGVTLIGRRLPGSIWHVAGRVAFYERLGVAKSVIVVASALELAITLVSGSLLVLVLFPTQAVWQPALFGGVALVLLLAIFAVHPVTLRIVLGRFGVQLKIALTRPLALAIVIFYQVGWLASGAIMVALMVHLAGVSPTDALPIICIWIIAGVMSNVIFFLPTGAGLNELIVGVLLSYYVSASFAATIALLMRLIITLCDLTVGVLFLFFTNSTRLNERPLSTRRQEGLEP